MKLALLLVAWGLVTVAVVGFVIPWMVSYPDTFLVIAGIFTALAYVFASIGFFHFLFFTFGYNKVNSK